jgi:hypothetical protein
MRGGRVGSGRSALVLNEASILASSDETARVSVDVLVWSEMAEASL